ncbi:hypothetical protein [Paenibacillus sp. 32352]|uniref:hypothetical protein n=1 Tax=Paenibacillus sp. 32352 TaxID=1969111 RepID=UPI0009AC8817|nr:hypothetical protein [Paenibacillus sp. 32352]
MSPIKVVDYIRYITFKLAGAGYAIFFLWVFVLLLTGFKLYESFASINEINGWITIYGYGFLCSIIIDLIVNYIPSKKSIIKLLLYAAAGFGFFIFSAGKEWIIFMGVFGVIFSLIFYWGTIILPKRRKMMWLFAFIIPLLLFTSMKILLADKKVNFHDVISSNSYEAKFDYFNGNQEIPIYLKKGQKLVYVFVWNTTPVGNGGAVGHQVLTPNGKYASLHQRSDHKHEINAEEEGFYKLVAHADRLKGSFTVSWDIE